MENIVSWGHEKEKKRGWIRNRLKTLGSQN
jgi:hypothetical protein